jgi:hypothetical protein
VEGPVDTASTEQTGIGGVDHDVDVGPGEIAEHRLQQHPTTVGCLP